MPGGDKTGPAGIGPMTGRAAGFCAGYDRPGYENRGFGRGMGSGRGHGRVAGFGRRYRAGFPGYETSYSPERERELKRRDIEQMEAELKAAKEDLERMEKGNAAAE